MQRLFVSVILVVLGSLAAHAASVPGVVGTSTVNGEQILVNAAGLSLYTYDVDKNGVSACYNGCAKAWPAVLVTAAEAQTLEAPFSTTTRTDGTLQLRYNNDPLYLYAGDESPGDVNGDGLGGVWHLIVE